MNTTRLEVMLAVRASHDEEYYKQGVKSKGVDPADLTHAEICAFKASMDAIEADIIMQVANESPVTNMGNIDLNKKLLAQ